MGKVVDALIFCELGEGICLGHINPLESEALGLPRDDLPLILSQNPA